MRSHVCVMVVAFDTLVASKQLQAAGVPESQADAIVTTLARGFGDNVATKDDLQIAVAKIEGKINELRGEMHRQTVLTLGTVLGAIGVATAIIVAAG